MKGFNLRFSNRVSRFKAHSFLHIITMYFFFQTECKTTPGDILKNVGHHLSAYENKEDYFKTVLPHLLLETWESVRKPFCLE